MRIRVWIRQELYVGGVQRSLHPQYHDEVPLSKALNPQLLPEPTAPGVCSRCVCVCALWMGYMQSTNSEYGSLYLAVCHVRSCHVTHTHTHTGVTDRLQWRAAAWASALWNPVDSAAHWRTRDTQSVTNISNTFQQSLNPKQLNQHLISAVVLKRETQIALREGRGWERERERRRSDSLRELLNHGSETTLWF